MIWLVRVMKIDDIVGHNEQIEQMINAYRSDRLAHAYLFYGPDEIGKKTVAKAFAQYVFCENSSGSSGNAGDSCSFCAPCRKIQAGNHPDMLIISPEKSVIKIDMIRDLQRKLQYGKYEAKFKFCIIDETEKLRVEAANALLKTLEEPARDTVIILVTSKINMLLPTIVSRCQKLRFNPLKDADITGELIRRYALGGDEAQVISAFLQGSFAKIEYSDFSKIIQLRRELVKRVKEASLNNLAGIISFSNELSGSDKELLVQTIEIIKTFYRDAAMLQTGLKDDLINKDIVKDIMRISSRLTKDELFEKINIMNQIQSSVMANVNKRLAVESMMIELCT